ncbi:hypothetical protein AWM68_13345 [Fictibacillus phosphorivorans]|uniref:Uncharacterized protein n=1 Tax=Fictibacillus phosphorivorans TaxID=1221500 RepID=A0A163PT33_9BACL|nr:heparinase II/III family protein [Fictibacillus phosphorivorans]KZE64086.1 hypothetical protein AWM68_13345 [Fictibacillus phosphorivorans]
MVTNVASIKSEDLLIVHSKVSNPNKLESIYEDYKNNIYMVSGRYTSVHLEDDELWTSEAHDRSWLFWHHCLVSVAYLIDSYYVDKNKDKLELAFSIIEKWYEANYPNSLSIMGWHDHSTALRLLHIVKLYLVLIEEKRDEDKLEKLSLIAEKHMEKLADPKFYMPKHNHGMDQDICLYIASTVISSKKSVEYKKLALTRFLDQVSNIFAEDGSYLEHSPHYIYLLAERLLNFYKILHLSNERESGKLLERIVKIIKFFIYTLQPDGNFPTLGDSELQSYDLDKDYWNVLPEELLQALRSIKKQETTEIEFPLDEFYTDGGYAFFRNNWENDNSTTQLTFYSAFHSRVHKHHDDLSIALYGHGIPLLIDCGKFTYQYDRPERHYVTSAYGHNTVRLNKSETDLSRLNINKSGILSFLATKNIGYSSGFHALMKGVVHRRIVFYLKPNDLIVLDLIKGDEATSAELIFNLSPELISLNQNNETVAYLENTPALLFQDLLSDHNPFKKYRGEMSPLKGWSSAFYGELKANDLLSKSASGNVIKFATHIRLKEDNHVQNFSWEDDVIRFKWKNFNIETTLTDFFEHIQINGKYFNSKKVFKNVNLLESITKNESTFFQGIK